MSTTKPGQMGQTRATTLSRESDVREEARESARCFFNDLCRKRKKRSRGPSSSATNTVWSILLDLKVSREV